MRLTDHDRKLLWGGAGRRCSYCQCRLVADASDVDRESIVGDEAHIVSNSERGPRADDGPRDNLDSYENAILLCKTHHKMVDDQPGTFTVDVLRRMKATHEQWVDEALSAAEKQQAADVAERAVAQHDLKAEYRRQMARFGPSDWCPTPNANGPELTLRCVVALPAPVALGPAPSTAVSRLDAEAREDLLAETLEAATVTADVRSQAPIWGWSDEHGWKAQGGSGSDDLTRLTFDLRWPSYHLRQPISMSAAVLTGATVGIGEPDAHATAEAGLVVALDVALNLIELDDKRRPANMAYRGTPPPAPAALTLSELAALLTSLVSVAEFAPNLAPALLGRSVEEHWIGLWLRCGSVELQRVIRLDTLDRLDDGLMVTSWMHVADSSDPASTDTQALVRDFMGGLLKRSDYRRFGDALESALTDINT